MVKQTISVALFFAYALFNTASFGQQFITDSLSIRNKIDSAFLIKEKDFNKAVRLCSKALDEAKASKSKELIKFAVYNSAMLDWYDGTHITALNKSNESLGLSKSLNDTVGIANSYSLLGLIYLYKADYDSSLHHFNSALLYYQTLKDTTQIIKTYGFIGLVYNKQGEYLKAKENLLSTVLLKRQHSTTNWYVLDVSKDVEVSRRYYRETLVDGKESLRKLEESNELSMALRNSYHNVGLSYLKLNYPDSALLLFKKSARVATQINADIFWNELSRAYTNLNLYDSAIWCNKKAIENSLDHGTRISLANGYDILGESYYAKGDYVNAIKAYKRALALHQFMGHKHAQMEMLQHLSESLLKQGLLVQALEYADSSIILARVIETKKGLVQGLNKRFDLLKLLGEYRMALEVKEVHDVLLDSLQKGEVQLNLAKLDLYNEVELNKLEISDLNKQKALAAANLNNRTLVIIIISIIVLFVVVLLLLNFLRTKKLRKLNVELNKQQSVIGTQNIKLTESNKEKELLLGEIHHRVKNNLQTITSLLSIQQRKLKDPDSIKVLEDSKNRVMAMGLIHQHLYQNDSFAEIDFKNYTKELVHVLVATNSCCEIDVKCTIPPLKIELDNAIFFGLIINELAINSIKHAYEGVKNPLLEIAISESNDKMALMIKDNGKEKDIDFDKSNSFGWKMVNNICDKLGGDLHIDNSDGLAITILFSKEIIDLKQH